MEKSKFIILQFLLTIFLFQFVTAQQLFLKTQLSQDLFSKIRSNYPEINTEKNISNMLFLEINENMRDNLYHNNDMTLEIDLPFLHSDLLSLSLHQFSVVDGDLMVTRHTQDGMISEYYSPKIRTYRINNSKKDISGVFILAENYIKAIIKQGEDIYVLDSFGDLNKNYFLSHVMHSPVDFDFLCANDHINHSLHHNHHRISNNDGLKCIDLAIEIDYFTFQTFQDYQLAIDWSLEMISVVSEIFSEELEVGLKSSSAQVWETNDPYSIFVEEPQNMLFSIRQNWSNNFQLSNIDRNLVHLFSKRNNTGTGGIAFLNGLGSTWNGYGFSSNLTDDTNYIDLPVPYFFWNIYCLAHELGHNLGARHTQWCGWPGGPIDNCANIEEMIPGECSSYNNNPNPEIGTIMSYCHTWSYSEGGGIMMKFNDLVKSSVLNYLNSQIVGSCLEEVLGCMDLNACNYNEEANFSDNSCAYPELGYDCFGNCINDTNSDGICNNDNLLISDNIHDLINIYPNPASNFIEIKIGSNFSNFVSLEIFNLLGDLVEKQQINSLFTSLDVSNLDNGIYTLRFINRDRILEQKIIIQ